MIFQGKINCFWLCQKEVSSKLLRTGLETQWVSPQERSPVLSGIKPTVSANADSSEKSLRDFVDLSSINQLELTKSIIERLRSGVETQRISKAVRPTGGTNWSEDVKQQNETLLLRLTGLD